MMWIFYQVLTVAALALAAPVLLAVRGRHYLETLPGRLGRRLPAASGVRGGLWIHAVSVGEVAVAETFARALPAEVPLLVTTVTPTGQRRAQAAFRTDEGPFAGRRIAVAYLPFDLAPLVRRFLDRFEPAALALVEGDYWPMVLRFARRRDMPVVVVNGRISERSFGRLRRLGRLNGPLFYDAVRRFGLQTEEDRRRLATLGVDDERLVVTGNLKFDTPEPPSLPELEAAVRGLAGERPILVAGSTMKGEDEHVLDALAQLRERALLVLVPRHPERWDGVARLVEERGFALQRRSRLAGEAPGPADVLLLDSLGELAALYRIAHAAFIGGTLVPTGGHNPLEPARFGVPVVVGPSMFNFEEMETAFNDAGAWSQVADAAGLAAAWRSWLDDPDAAAGIGGRGREVVDRNRGAVGRTEEMIRPYIPCVPSPRSSQGDNASREDA